MFFEYDFSFPFQAWVRGCFLYFLLWLRCCYLVCTIYKSCAGDVGKVELSGWRRPCWAKGARALPVAQSLEGVIRSFYLWCDPQRDIIKARMCLHKACSASSFHWRTDQQVPEGMGVWMHWLSEERRWGAASSAFFHEAAPPFSPVFWIEPHGGLFGISLTDA